MQSWAEIILAVVIHASALAYSHLGVTLTPQIPQPVAQDARRVARSDMALVRVKACPGASGGSACWTAPASSLRD